MPTEKFLARRRPPEPAARVWLIDMDDTLYCASSGMFDALHRNIEAWLADRLGLGAEEAGAVRVDYWRNYGTTFLGLVRNHDIVPEEYFAATHAFGAEELKRLVQARTGSAALRAALLRIPGRRILVTNGPRRYARGVLGRLHLAGVFEDVIAAEDMRSFGRWRCKPDPGLFPLIAARAGARPGQCTLVEDSLPNLRAAKACGMRTVWCRGYSERAAARTDMPAYVDRAVGSLAELAGAGR
ncbi:MAG: pyrimidine 5'-nucleotidase [Duodenibacillus sp.]|nr:pyrimidine 5'-nucleotidase [Duodenibacillus sp.]